MTRNEPTRSSSHGSSSSTPSFSLMVMQRSLASKTQSSSPVSPTSAAVDIVVDPMIPQIGILRFKDGRIFEGEHIGGHMLQGKMTYADGSVYQGGWLNDKRHGRGICTFVDNSEYEGEFYQGNFHGYGKMTWNDNGYYVGQWYKGEIHGKGIEVRSDGSIRHDGIFSNGMPIRCTPPRTLRKNLSTDSPEIIA